MFEYLVFVAAAGSIAAAIVYIRSMFKGNTKPNRVTWLMWMIAPFIATAASLSSGAGLVALPIFAAGFSPLLIFLASFFSKKAYWKLVAFDYVCGILSAIALALWRVTSNPNTALIFAIISDALAAIPTLLKAWRNPETESAWPYIIGILSPMTSYLAATAFTFPQLAFPTYLIAINALLLLPLMRRKE